MSSKKKQERKTPSWREKQGQQQFAPAKEKKLAVLKLRD
jgi:hypothetical protein